MQERRRDRTEPVVAGWGYLDSAAFLAANTIGLFAALASGPQTASSLAEQLSSSPGVMALLLDACVRLGFLAAAVRHGAAFYENTPAASAILVHGFPGLLRSAVR